MLTVVALFRSAANINVGLILAKEKYKWPLYWGLVLLAIVPLTIILASKFTGSLVVVGATLAGIHMCLFVLGYLLFPRRLLGRFDWSFLSDVGRPVLAACVMLPVVMFAIDEVTWGSLWTRTFMMTALGGTIYAAASLLIQRQHTSEVIEFLRARG